MTGTYAGQFVMEGFFDIKLPVWKRVLVTRSIAILPALVVAFMPNFDNADNYLNILQNVQLPFAMIPLIKFTSSEKVMGKRFANNKCMKYFAIIMGFILIAINASGLIPLGCKFNNLNVNSGLVGLPFDCPWFPRLPHLNCHHHQSSLS